MTVSKEQILDGALAVLRDGGTITLDSAAERVGLTKPGLMHHFRTKQALMLGVVDHLVDGYERELRRRLDVPLDEATTAQRLAAYLDWSLTGGFDESDLAMLTDPRLRTPMTKRWSERLDAWVGVPDDLPPADRARLVAVRLIADGSWFADATGALPLAGALRDDVRELARQLLHPDHPGKDRR
ncbi:TetR/AcrR family transcriptional regulator [Solicola sp. PLA-1-18]|uniref:TetR/AcrR family transcriptional regulator n=1 Tax=Solicola sp. PLA-1-18 TaxID=3380532 RepID=UPI003B75EFE0